MKVFNILIFAALLASCNTQVKDSEITSSKQTEQKKKSGANCYAYVSKSDTVTFNVTHIGDSISGYLAYSYKEKDKNKGTIRGIMKDGLLVADYTFISEGIQSIRQVAFKLIGDSFVEGYGESFIQDDRSYFKNIDSLNFDSSFKLKEIGCQ
jgi:hypothetical protein